MLGGLLEVLAERRPAALLLAGDLYDRSIPPPEAVRLFDSFLSRAVAADPGLVVVAIPGNHDSAARLSFGTQIMSKAGVHIRTDPRLCVEPIVVKRDGERVAIWALPFLSPGAFEIPPEVEGETPPAAGAGGQAELEFDAQPPAEIVSGLRGQAELFAEAMRRMRPLLGAGDGAGRPGLNVLVAHCFAAGAASSESERTFVGAAEQVDISSFAAFDYVALGHLHRFQRAGAKGRYAGSPLAYSFVEGEEAKGFVLVDFESRGRLRGGAAPPDPPRTRCEGSKVLSPCSPRPGPSRAAERLRRGEAHRSRSRAQPRGSPQGQLPQPPFGTAGRLSWPRPSEAAATGPPTRAGSSRDRGASSKTSSPSTPK